jgi:hypothetical protein
MVLHVLLWLMAAIFDLPVIQTLESFYASLNVLLDSKNMG